MSSSFIVEPQESGTGKNDDTLIIVVNDDGTLSVDQETLQNLIMNQSNANVSVVRLGQTEADAGNGDVTLTVDPPTFVPSTTTTSLVPTTSTDTTGLVDPFMEMDLEQLERLETALQSEEAKQILGENVTAMLDMLSVEERQNSIKYSIELDHCYTSRLSPSDPKPREPLPVVHSPTSDDIPFMHNASPARVSVPGVQSNTSDTITDTPIRSKQITKSGKPIGRPRRGNMSVPFPMAGTSKSVPGNAIGLNKSGSHLSSRSTSGLSQPSNKEADDAEEEAEDSSPSSESSESEPPSDSDEDFGPRGPRRGGVRARGGRKGLTTRGGSMTGNRRRGPNKHLDMEQVRRLDIEMAAAVNAMKSPEKDDKSGGFSPMKGRRQYRTPGRKKEEQLAKTLSMPETSTPIEKPLQTTNQVKANLINANMIKGDMILTKPGQGRNNQKVTFIQKRVPMDQNELKTVGIKKQILVPKGKLNQITTKFLTTKDGKLVQVTTTPKAATAISPDSQPKVVLSQPSSNQQPSPPLQQQVQQTKAVTTTTPLKDVKKERKKSETSFELPQKNEIDTGKPGEIKLSDSAKKHAKKEHRKSPACVADSLGPALFSTPDIIRRVGSNSDMKSGDTPTVPSSSPTSSTFVTSASVPTCDTSLTTSYGINTGLSSCTNSANESSMEEKTANDKVMEEDVPSEKGQIDEENQESSTATLNEEPPKIEAKVPSAEELQPSLDSGVFKGVMEGEDHLIATLEMEANKVEAELLAEALFLHEDLGVDLTDHVLSKLSKPISLEDQAATPAIESVPSSVEATPQQIKHIDALSPQSSISTASIKKKDEKEPIQIVRGGRVITLPPIEAPATRSKRLQAKIETVRTVANPENSRKKSEFVERVAERNQDHATNQAKQQSEMQREMEMNRFENDEDDEEDDDDDEDEDNSDSEDDPNRLWCICKRPHNNRFMICCDVCEDWFHGKCVHVSKAMGQQMEEKGIEWICPNCTKRKNDDVKINSQPVTTKPQRGVTEQIVEKPTPQRQNTALQTTTSVAAETVVAQIVSHNADRVMGKSSGTMQCVVCKNEARNSSIYCSDACILAHAQETLTKDKPMPTTPQPRRSKSPTPVDPSKVKATSRVIVYDRKTGKVLSGSDAPTMANLKVWLKENPNYEVVRSNALNTIQVGDKTVMAVSTQGLKTAGRPMQAVGIKPQTVPKMIYAKIPGSKQTVLTSAANKRLIAISGAQQQMPMNVTPTKQTQLKQMSPVPTAKTPTILRQVTPKGQAQVQTKAQTPPMTKQTPVKKLEQKPSPSQTIKQQPKMVLAKAPETEPIRLNVRKTLTELLTTRIRETEDLKLTDEEISDLALNIELELYKCFKDTGAKYKAKYRSLVFNIKDTKNLTLFRKISDRSLTPDAVVRLSPDEMASQELAEWREKETKHQLEMIKKNELDLMAQAKSIVVKTHKGEQIIENDGEIERVDPQTPVQDIVTALNSSNITSTVDDDEKEKDEEKKHREDGKRSKGMDEDRRKDKEKDRDRHGRSSRDKGRERRSSSRNRHHRSKERDRSKTRDKSKERKLSKKDREKEKDRGKDRERTKDRERERSKEKTKDKTSSNKKEKDRYKGGENNSKNGRNEHKDHRTDKKEFDDKKKDTEKKDELGSSEKAAEKPPIEDRLWRHIEDEATTNTIDGNDSDLSDREPTSTVTIKTPDINEEPEKEKESETAEREALPKGTSQTVWRGFVNMVDVAKFFITATDISGNARDLTDDLPDTVDVVGRISPETVWEYISKMKKTGSKEILVTRLTAANDEEKIPYITLYSYLNSRLRYGVVGNVSRNIKDFYIMPFSSQSEVPPVLRSLIGPKFEEHRPHLLLGILVCNKRKRVSAIPSSISSKVSKKEHDRSYTPPLVSSIPKEKVKTTTPPTSPRQSYQKSSLMDISSKEKPVVTQMTLESLNKAHIGMSRSAVMDSATISKIVPELSSKIDLTSSPSKVSPLDDDDGDDDDEPYSPGEMDDEMNNRAETSDSAVPCLMSSSDKEPSDLQRKMDELNRQIEEQKQQIQSISSSFLGDTTSTLPGLGMDPPSYNDSEEAYSPSDVRSFTPPPPTGITKFTQPILEKVSGITIPPNLQEILANVKRQESTKVDPYLPAKPGATFLTTLNSAVYQNSEKYSSPSHQSKSSSGSEKASNETNASAPKEQPKSTLSTLSDLDLIKKAEEELAAVAAASAMAATTVPPPAISQQNIIAQPTTSSTGLNSAPPVQSTTSLEPISMLPGLGSTYVKPSTSHKVAEAPPPHLQAGPVESFKKIFASEQPKPPGLEDEDFPPFPSTPPPSISKDDNNTSKIASARSKFVPKSGVVLSVKRKVHDEGDCLTPSKNPRTKSRWGQGPSE